MSSSLIFTKHFGWTLQRLPVVVGPGRAAMGEGLLGMVGHRSVSAGTAVSELDELELDLGHLSHRRLGLHLIRLL
jgi:hypothetical protein